MTLIERSLKECSALWESYLEQSFLKDIRNHVLEESIFIHYLIEDSKYLKDYARVFGMGIYKSTTMDEITLFYEMLKFVELNESAVRVKLLKKKGYDVCEIERQPQHPITKEYTDYLHQIAQEGELVDMLFVTLPCLVSYAYIGEKLIEENPNIIEESPYGSWIEEYTSESYRKKCKKWMKCADRMSECCSEEKKAQLKQCFLKASELEYTFWEMSYNGKVCG